MSTVTLHKTNGEIETRSIEAVAGVARLTRADVGAGVDHIDFMTDFMTAHAGDQGCMVVPSVVNNGVSALVEFHDRADTESAFRRNLMFMYGCVRNGRGKVGVITGMSFEYSLVVGVKEGTYYTYPRFHLDGEVPYEDIEVMFYDVEGADATYVGMAAAYRSHQLARGFVRPLRERMAENSILAKAVQGPEVRMRLAWKPAAPSPVEEQTEENEPEMHVAMTFDRAGEVMDEFHRQGIRHAEFCLVGWNKSGHDGRFPDLLPVEPKLGGEEGLRRLIAKAKSYGYLITGHTNLIDSYSIAKRYDPELLQLKKDGKETLGGSWGGGRAHVLCPRAAYERLAGDDFKLLKNLGFEGLHYIDVLSILLTESCYHPKHPLTRRDAAYFRNRMLKLAQESIGGSGSEGAYDFTFCNLDFALYVFFNLKAQLPPICDRVIPLWMIAYHGILQYNTACDCVNANVKSDPKLNLVNFEYGGKPTYYYYSAFTANAWMGKEDLVCDTPEQLVEGVAKVKANQDAYEKILDLQTEYITEHRQLADGVMLTGYGNGKKMAVNYTERPFDYEGQRIDALGFKVW